MAQKKAKKNVKVTYGKASSTPSTRLPKPPRYEMRTPQAASSLHKYVQENEESGLPVSELIQQFQEYDCEHQEWEQISWTPRYVEYRCVSCSKVEKHKRTGL